MKIRSQEDLKTAYRLVASIGGKSKDVKDAYGSLCHSFPILVRQCGLAQALAFSESKKGGKTAVAQAHAILLDHVKDILDLTVDPVQQIQTDDALTYIYRSRRVLHIWIYFKRFAVSILDVKDATVVDTTGS